MSRKRGILRAAQRCLSRVCSNAGNRGFLRGGRAIVVIPHLGRLGKALLLAKVLAPDLPEPPEPEDLAGKVRKVLRGEAPTKAKPRGAKS